MASIPDGQARWDEMRVERFGRLPNHLERVRRMAVSRFHSGCRIPDRTAIFWRQQMRTTIAAGIIVTLLSAAPAFAGPHPHQRAATITRWALIGAGAGFGIGFFQGMRVYDDATYAEQKIWRAAWLSALAGAAIGGAIGAVRSKPARMPDTASRPDTSLSKSTWAHVRLEAPASPTDRLYRGLFARPAESFFRP
jgi:hypothetical protein